MDGLRGITFNEKPIEGLIEEQEERDSRRTFDEAKPEVSRYRKPGGSNRRREVMGSAGEVRSLSDAERFDYYLSKLAGEVGRKAAGFGAANLEKIRKLWIVFVRLPEIANKEDLRKASESVGVKDFNRTTIMLVQGGTAIRVRLEGVLGIRKIVRDEAEALALLVENSEELRGYGKHVQAPPLYDLKGNLLKGVVEKESKPFRSETEEVGKDERIERIRDGWESFRRIFPALGLREYLELHVKDMESSV